MPLYHPAIFAIKIERYLSGKQKFYI